MLYFAVMLLGNADDRTCSSEELTEGAGLVLDAYCRLLWVLGFLWLPTVGTKKNFDPIMDTVNAITGGAKAMR